MTSAPTDASPQQSPTKHKPALAIPLIVWLLIQLAAVALAASGAPLSADFPRPPQALAVHEMLVAQFVGSAIFLPVLFRGWRAWLGMVLTAGPMLFVAAGMTSLPASRVLVLWLEVAVWLTALAAWRAVLPRRADVLAAAAILLSSGGLLFWYLSAEFRPVPERSLVDLLPLAGTLRHLGATITNLSPLLSTVALAAAALIVLAVKAAICRKSGRSPESLN